MAIVRLLPSEVENWLGDRPKAPRTEGAHVSVVVLSMLKEIAERRYGSWGKGGEREPQYEPGYLWEDILTAALAKSPPVVAREECFVCSQLEIVAGEGDQKVYGTPDGIHWRFADQRFIVDERKATWYSYRPLAPDPTQILEIRKFDYWCFQAQTYAAMLLFGGYAMAWNTPGTASGNMLVGPEMYGPEGPPPHVYIPDKPPLVRIGALFLNGTYRGDRALPYRCEIEWSEEELRTWWRTVKQHAARMAARAKEQTQNDAPEPPPIQ